MGEKVLRYLLLGLLWGLVATTIYVAARRSHAHRNNLCVKEICIEILDSTAHGQLVTREKVQEWLSDSGMTLQGRLVEEVDLEQVEKLIAANGFVGEVNCTIDYEGRLSLAIRQREPLFRLVVDGYNHYVTSDGRLFRAPHNAALYVPVVTGSYRPPFAPEYEGTIEALREESHTHHEEQMAEIEREKFPFYEQEKENRDYHRMTNRMFIKRAIFESREHFDRRVETLRAEKRARRRHYRYRARQIEQAIAEITLRQQAESDRQKKLEKNYEDFENLITFVEKMEGNAFWRAEMVQLIASEAHSGALEVEFVPRSGGFTVMLGRLEEVVQKLSRLERFYDRGLAPQGWERFRRIDLRYRDRVVCTTR